MGICRYIPLNISNRYTHSFSVSDTSDRQKQDISDVASEGRGDVSDAGMVLSGGSPLPYFLVPIEDYIRLQRFRQINEISVRKYESFLRRIAPFIPNKPIVNLTIDDLQDVVERYKTSEYYIGILTRYLDYCGNPILRDNPIRFPHHQYVGRWLTVKQAQDLIDICLNPGDRWVIHGMMELGMRRAEVLYLTWGDIDEQQRRIKVVGKGRLGGKIRYLPYHPKTEELVASMKLYRMKLVKDTTEYYGNCIDDSNDRILVYTKGGRLKALQKTAMDNKIDRLSTRFGMKFTAHDLRRTFARIFYDANDKDIATVCYALGHSRVLTTMHYLGLNIDQVSDGLEKMAKVLK